MARPSRTSQAILGFLTWRPMTGYDIRKAVAGSTGYFWSESFGQIYPALKRLVASGDITALSATAGDGRAGRAYSLTPRGMDTLCAWLEQPPAEREPPRNELLLKLFFGRHNDTAVNARHVARHREQALARFENYTAIERDLRRRHGGHPDLRYWLMTVSYGKHVERALIGWCDDTLAELDGLGDATPSTAPAPSTTAQEEPADDRYQT